MAEKPSIYAMHAAPRCGAKTRRGTPCQSPAMANGRCRMHGGKLPGAPRGNRYAWKHGLLQRGGEAEAQGSPCADPGNALANSRAWRVKGKRWELYRAPSPQRIPNALGLVRANLLAFAIPLLRRMITPR